MIDVFSIATIAEKIIRLVIPDPQAQAEARLKVLELTQQGQFHELDNELKLMVDQIGLNKVEAESSNVFKSGWRPFIGWVCGIGFTYAVVVYPVLTWAATVYNITPPPNLETGILMSTMLGMLGLGGMRSFEKFKQITK